MRLTWGSGDQPTDEFVQLAFKGESTVADMDPDVSYVNMRDALMNINDGATSNVDFLVGHIDVERSTINGDQGYVYTIVFEDTETNAGDQPMLTPISDPFTGTASIRVYEVTSGIRAGGAPEVQKISIAGSTGPVDGYWRAQFAASNFRWVRVRVAEVDMLAPKHVFVVELVHWRCEIYSRIVAKCFTDNHRGQPSRTTSCLFESYNTYCVSYISLPQYVRFERGIGCGGGSGIGRAGADRRSDRNAQRQRQRQRIRIRLAGEDKAARLVGFAEVAWHREGSACSTMWNVCVRLRKNPAYINSNLYKGGSRLAWG